MSSRTTMARATRIFRAISGASYRELNWTLAVACGLPVILGAACGGLTSADETPARAGAPIALVVGSEAVAQAPRWNLDLPLRTWMPRPAPGVGQGPMPDGDGKHSRMLFDSKRGRMVLAGGDYAYEEPGIQTSERYSGIHLVWSIDLSHGDHATWKRLTPWCAQPSGVQPGRPDTVVWVYDSRRDQGVMMPGFYHNSQGDPPPTLCPGVNQTLDSVLFNFATNTWSLPPYGPPPGKGGYGGDEGSSFGVYDPVTDAVYRFRRVGNTSMEILDRATNSWEQIPLGTEGTGVGETRANRDQPAIDVRGRSIYVISWRMRALIRYSIPAKRVIETTPMPPKWIEPFTPGDHETWMTFDPINRVLLIPVARDFYGLLVGLAIYHVDAKKWEWDDPPRTGPQVSGNVVGFDPVNNAMIFLGRSKAQVWWLYRYGNGLGAPAVKPLGSKQSIAPIPTLAAAPTPPPQAAPSTRRAMPGPGPVAAESAGPTAAPSQTVTSAAAPPPDPAALARLEAMPDNSWLPLNPKPRTVYQPAVAPENSAAPDLRNRTVVSGEPVARSYSGLAYGDGMVFNFGGGHATHPGNDVDLYLIDANQWVDQYPPESPANGTPEAHTIVGAGSAVAIITPLGRPYTQHTYQQSTYDSKRKRFLTVVPSGTWAWDPTTKNWILLAGPSKGTFSPDFALSHGNVINLPDEDALLLFVTAPRNNARRGTYRFNGSNNTWSFVGPFPSEQEFSYKELYSVYNPDRREVAVVVSESRLFRYRLSDNTWTAVTSFPPAFRQVYPNFAYDTRHKLMVFLITPMAGKPRVHDRLTQIWVWDQAKDTWSSVPTPPTAPVPIADNDGERGSLVYDPTRNVFIFLKIVELYCGIGGYDCGGTTKTWAYRYKG